MDAFPGLLLPSGPSIHVVHWGQYQDAPVCRGWGLVEVTSTPPHHAFDSDIARPPPLAQSRSVSVKKGSAAKLPLSPPLPALSPEAAGLAALFDHVPDTAFFV